MLDGKITGRKCGVFKANLQLANSGCSAPAARPARRIACGAKVKGQLGTHFDQKAVGLWST